jgi:acyl transferase domain-containing protein/acyl carrier protein
MSVDTPNPNDVAVVGMDARVPGAPSLSRYWENVRNGVESVQFSAPGPPVVTNGVAHVKAAPLLDDIELFDAGFFGFNPREAEVMDPQIRLFMECAWTALETAGCDAAQFPGRIGVFAGSAGSSYLTANILPSLELLRSSGGALSSYGVFNERDALATIVAYKFDLTGPALSVQTFCSTSLVAVHLACQSLLNGESDVALAGAASINVQLSRGYIYQEGGILSPDGHTRTFDEKAAGTVFGNGVGAVVLMRLADAVADGHVIHAVIRGSAINNDGAQKAGYTAPSVVGQAKAIAEAMAVAGVSPESIGYVEAHGTATALGDPIEIEALTRAFRAGTPRKGYCRIGSVKANFGHLDRAAGVASLIKTILMLKHREIPPLLHFERPNPKIDFEASPFVVARDLQPWTADGPLRAGVSSLGVGGTNAHVVLEEAPARPVSGPTRACQMLVLSARTESALDAATLGLVRHLKERPQDDLGDAAFTLLQGRRRFEHRRVVVAESAARAVSALEALDPKRVLTGYGRSQDRSVVFMFPGQGAQYAGMTRGLYEAEAAYRKVLDECADKLLGPLGLDIRGLLFPSPEKAEEAGERLTETAITQPALFAVEYALARLWMGFGITPAAMIGHSIGEYVAATLAGVFSLDDALALVAERGRLVQSMAPGSMLAVHLPAVEVQPLLGRELSLAAVNAPSLSVVSGPTAAVDALEEELKRRDKPTARLRTSHAFHSAMMDPVLAPFRASLLRVKLQAPKLAFVSNLTGALVKPDEAASPDYWVEHLRGTVQFAQGMETLLAEPERVFLEVGPGNVLTTLARQQAPRASGLTVVPSVRHPRDDEGDLPFLLGALGRLWVAGTRVNAAGVFAGEKRQRLELPTYPFERERYWVEVDESAHAATRSAPVKKDPADWFYVPTWKSALPLQLGGRRNGRERGGSWLVFGEAEGLAELVVRRLREQGDVVLAVRPGPSFSGNSRDGYVVDPASRLDYDRLLRALGDQGKTIGGIVHAFAATPPRDGEPTPQSVAESQARGYYSLLHLCQALRAATWTQPLQLKVLTTGVQEVLDGDAVDPGTAMLLGLLKVVPQELHNVTCSSIDVDGPGAPGWEPSVAADRLVEELRASAPGAIVAYRRQQRFVQGFDPVRLPAVEGRPARLRDQGVYLITGGLGGVTFVLAAALAHLVKARLVLTGRAVLPEREEWDTWRERRGASDPVSQRILRVQTLEGMGAEVLLVSADAGSLEDMTRAVAAAEERFGALHGVIHGAGIVGGGTFRPIEEIGAQECEQQFHPKVAGLMALDRALGDRPLDFCLLTSSLSSVLGGFAYGAYAAANVFMDAYTRCHNRRSRSPWVSVNWDEWRLSEHPDERPGGLARFAMGALEGAGAFVRILDLSGVPQVVVSTGELQARLDQWTKLEGLRGAGADPAKATGRARHARPHLQNAYVAPGTPSEQKIARIWAELLGMEKVGIQDNFFDLGGHSLLAIQVVTRIRAELQVEVSVSTLFEGPTVESLGRLIGRDEEGGRGFENSSDRGRRRKEERQRRQAERMEEMQ